jgi:hypothetical protein
MDLAHGTQTVMAGRSKITARKIENLELGALNKIINDKVDIVLDKKHPLALMESDVEARDALMDLSLEDFKKHLEANLRLLSSKTLQRMINELKKIPTHRLPAVFQIINDALTRLQGEPTQRIEVTKNKFNQDNWDEFIKTLPKKAEVIEDEKKGSKSIPST